MDYLAAFGPDATPQVRREMAIALRLEKSQKAVDLWTQLAYKYDGDRWFLEALGIGSDLNADACFRSWLTEIGEHWNQGLIKTLYGVQDPRRRTAA